MEFDEQNCLSNSIQTGKQHQLHFLNSDEDSFEENSFDNFIGPSESESFISASDEVVFSCSDFDSNIIDELGLNEFLHKKEIHFSPSHELKIIRRDESYSENDCETINTDLPEPNLLDELDKIEKETSNSSDFEHFEDELY